LPKGGKRCLKSWSDVRFNKYAPIGVCASLTGS
jgi:hypothetical protein